MAACDPIEFNNISPQLFSNIRQQLAEKGFDLSGSSGVVNGPFGIVIQYTYDEASEYLKLEVLEKSFFVSCRQIKDQLNNALAQYI